MVLIGSLGNLIEWYDWYAWGAFSLYFAGAFFPSGDRTAQLTNAAAVFAVGFLVRPLGAWAMGSFADRRGRRDALSLSVLLMCAGSLMIACAPTHAVAGHLGGAILLVARVMQGLSVGGEYGASSAYIGEIASRKHGGFASSLLATTVVLGQLLAIGVLVVLQFVVLDAQELAAWGWRIPFGIGGALAIFVYYLRRGMAETAVFDEAAHRADRPRGVAALAPHWRLTLIVGGMSVGSSVAFYTYTVYMQKFLVNTAGMNSSQSTTVAAATLIYFLLLQPVIGAFSDRVGRKPVLFVFGIGGTLLTVPLLERLSRTHSVWEAAVLIMIGLTLVSCYLSINSIVKAELFPVQVRALGIALPHAITVSVFGGTTEYVALWCKAHGHEALFYWYVTACIACALISFLFIPETRWRSRIEDGAFEDMLVLGERKMIRKAVRYR